MESTQVQAEEEEMKFASDYRGSSFGGFPKNSDELKARGWKFQNDSTCNKCGDSIEWWDSPNGKPLPFNPMEKGLSPAIKHFETCTG
jgi:hypothetical protein